MSLGLEASCPPTHAKYNISIFSSDLLLSIGSHNLQFSMGLNLSTCRGINCITWVFAAVLLLLAVTVRAAPVASTTNMYTQNETLYSREWIHRHHQLIKPVFPMLLLHLRHSLQLKPYSNTLVARQEKRSQG
jgi:hypothetical protein